METFAITHQGLIRRENQDRYLFREFEDQVLLMAVADGMGGEAGGGLAAQIAIEAVGEFTPPDLTDIEASLIELFLAASRRIEDEVRKDPRLKGMGTTLTAACIKNGITSWAHVGDSRLYLWRKEHLTQITEDHTFVNNLVKQGVITEGEARCPSYAEYSAPMYRLPTRRDKYGPIQKFQRGFYPSFHGWTSSRGNQGENRFRPGRGSQGQENIGRPYHGSPGSRGAR